MRYVATPSGDHLAIRRVMRSKVLVEDGVPIGYLRVCATGSTPALRVGAKRPRHAAGVGGALPNRAGCHGAASLPPLATGVVPKLPLRQFQPSAARTEYDFRSEGRVC